MTMRLKYVKLQSEEVIVFPVTIDHDTFKYLLPKTAGFCEISEDKVNCFGHSMTLNLKSDQEKDSLHATKQFLGVEAYLKLLSNGRP